ncbi:uncharacterized protein LOC143888853 [Tasmannia lanceolata]|uniref:uncharacterized protein LOC143888853 n=1 Tax=Tasmannia lanceolata TaxID=3420 RepID=UPI0040638E7C
MAIENLRGDLTLDPGEIEDIMVSHFKSILNQNDIVCNEDLIPNPTRKISPSEAEWLSRPISIEEVEKTIWSQDGNKAPGPDGFTGRLKEFMNKLINPLQSTFIRGRSIQDNILLTQDLCHNFHRQSHKPAMCIKMDLRKAFDNGIFQKLKWAPAGRSALPSPLLHLDGNDIFPEAAGGILRCMERFRICSGLEQNQCYLPSKPIGVRFNLPVSILHSIDKIIRDFIWTGYDHKSFHPISWETLCYPKKEGGMGIRKASDINRVAQWRHIWHILEKSYNPWSIWFRSKYLRGRNFWQIPMPHTLSWGARSIFKNRDEFKVRICYLVSEGRGLNFWTDPWHPDGPVDYQTSIGSMLSNIPRNVSVHDIRSDPNWKEVLTSGPYGELNQIVHSGLFTKELQSYLIWEAHN